LEAQLPLLDVLNRCSIPLYGKRKGRSIPELVGSGVLLGVEDYVFLLTAAHVLELFEEANFQLQIDDQWIPVSGRPFTTPPVNGSHVRAPIDAAVVCLEGELQKRLRTRSLKLEDLHTFDRGFEVLYTVSGFALKHSRRQGQRVYSAPSLLSLQGQPQSLYDQLQLDPRLHLVLESTKRVMWLGGIKEAPTTAGLSGGPVFIVPGIRRSTLRPKLTAIFIEGRNSPPVMIATSVTIHLSLIVHHIPELSPVVRAHETETAYDDWIERTEVENLKAKVKLPQELRSLLRP
jgi:hypothetical protein